LGFLLKYLSFIWAISQCPTPPPDFGMSLSVSFFSTYIECICYSRFCHIYCSTRFKAKYSFWILNITACQSFEIMKYGPTKGFLMVLFFPCYAARLDTYVIENRESALLNSLLQNFQPCQITLLSMHSSSIQFFSRNTQSMQIFVFPFNYTEDLFIFENF